MSSASEAAGTQTGQAQGAEVERLEFAPRPFAAFRVVGGEQATFVIGIVHDDLVRWADELGQERDAGNQAFERQHRARGQRLRRVELAFGGGAPILAIVEGDDERTIEFLDGFEVEIGACRPPSPMLWNFGNGVATILRRDRSMTRPRATLAAGGQVSS